MHVLTLQHCWQVGSSLYQAFQHVLCGLCVHKNNGSLKKIWLKYLLVRVHSVWVCVRVCVYGRGVFVCVFVYVCVSSNYTSSYRFL
jgi:hypothetical protein